MLQSRHVSFAYTIPNVLHFTTITFDLDNYHGCQLYSPKKISIAGLQLQSSASHCRSLAPGCLDAEQFRKMFLVPWSWISGCRAFPNMGYLRWHPFSHHMHTAFYKPLGRKLQNQRNTALIWTIMGGGGGAFELQLFYMFSLIAFFTNYLLLDSRAFCTGIASMLILVY